MAVYYTDFSEYTLDQPPGDWTMHCATPQYVDTNVVADAGATGGARLSCSEQSITDYAFTWDTPGVLDDCEILARVYPRLFGYSSSVDVGSVLLRCQDQNNYYGVGFDDDSTDATVYLYKVVAGVTTVLDSAPTTIDSLQWVKTRFQTVGDQLNAKVWLSSDPEPVDWMLTATDTSFTSGYAGVLSGTYHMVWASYDTVQVTGIVPDVTRTLMRYGYIREPAVIPWYPLISDNFSFEWDLNYWTVTAGPTPSVVTSLFDITPSDGTKFLHLDGATPTTLLSAPANLNMGPDWELGMDTGEMQLYVTYQQADAVQGGSAGTDLYVLDYGENLVDDGTIKKYSDDGTYQGSFPVPKQIASNNWVLDSLGWDGTHFIVTVTDWTGDESTVCKYQLDGTYDGVLFTAPFSQIYSYVHILYAAGNYYAWEWYWRTHKFDSNGTYIGVEFETDWGQLAVYDGTEFIVAGDYGDPIRWYDLTGTFTGETFDPYPNVTIISGISWDGTDVWLYDRSGDRIVRYQRDGTWLGEISTPEVTYGTGLVAIPVTGGGQVSGTPAQLKVYALDQDLNTLATVYDSGSVAVNFSDWVTLKSSRGIPIQLPPYTRSLQVEITGQDVAFENIQLYMRRVPA